MMRQGYSLTPVRCNRKQAQPIAPSRTKDAHWVQAATGMPQKPGVAEREVPSWLFTNTVIFTPSSRYLAFLPTHLSALPTYLPR
jgi:hypothetical protein